MGLPSLFHLPRGWGQSVSFLTSLSPSPSCLTRGLEGEKLMCSLVCDSVHFTGAGDRYLIGYVGDLPCPTLACLHPAPLWEDQTRRTTGRTGYSAHN